MKTSPLSKFDSSENAHWLFTLGHLFLYRVYSFIHSFHNSLPRTYSVPALWYVLEWEDNTSSSPIGTQHPVYKCGHAWACVYTCMCAVRTSPLRVDSESCSFSYTHLHLPSVSYILSIWSVTRKCFLNRWINETNKARVEGRKEEGREGGDKWPLLTSPVTALIYASVIAVTPFLLEFCHWSHTCLFWEVTSGLISPVPSQ